MPSLRTAVATATAGLAFAGSAQALPLMDVEVGARYWQANPSGDVAYKGNGDSWDVDDDLGFDKEGTPNLYARAALPFITLDAEYTDLAFEGKTDGAGLTWNNRTFTTSGDPTSFDARILHGGAMFNVPLPVVDLGLGVGATNIDAQAEIDNERGSANFTLPVAKAEVRVDFPAVPLNAGIRGQVIGYDGDSYRDITAEVGYELGLLQIRAGYRQIALEYEGNDFDVDTDFSGPFAGLHLAF